MVTQPATSFYGNSLRQLPGTETYLDALLVTPENAECVAAMQAELAADPASFPFEGSLADIASARGCTVVSVESFAAHARGRPVIDGLRYARGPSAHQGTGQAEILIRHLIDASCFDGMVSVRSAG